MADKELRQIPLAAMFITLGLVFPQVFHLFGSGSVFLPMFLPVYLGAMFLDWKYAGTVAVTTPLISFLITGMPPIVPPILILMIVELLASALIISFLFVHKKMNVWIVLVTAIFTGRIIYYLAISQILPMLGFEHAAFSIALLLKSFPGILLQLLVIPPAVKLIAKKYPSIIRKD